MAATPANVAVHALPDLVIAGSGLCAQQRDRGDDHAAGAVRALERAFIEKRLLDRVQRVAVRQPFDGGDGLTGDVADRLAAGENALIVQQHAARAAIALPATEARAGQAKL